MVVAPGLPDHLYVDIRSKEFIQIALYATVDRPGSQTAADHQDCLLIRRETDYSPAGLRDILLERNFDVVSQMKELKLKRLNKEISEDDFKKQATEIKGSKDAPVILIKATDEASYRNLVDALDEMQICNIGKYAIVDITDGDKFLIDNLKSGGELTRQIARSNPKK